MVALGQILTRVAGTRCVGEVAGRRGGDDRERCKTGQHGNDENLDTRIELPSATKTGFLAGPPSRTVGAKSWPFGRAAR